MKTVSGRQGGSLKKSQPVRSKARNTSKVLARVAKAIERMPMCHSRGDGCHNIAWHDPSCHPSFRSSGGCH